LEPEGPEDPDKSCPIKWNGKTWKINVERVWEIMSRIRSHVDDRFTVWDGDQTTIPRRMRPGKTYELKPEIRPQYQSRVKGPTAPRTALTLIINGPEYFENFRTDNAHSEVPRMVGTHEGPRPFELVDMEGDEMQIVDLRSDGRYIVSKPRDVEFDAICGEKSSHIKAPRGDGKAISDIVKREFGIERSVINRTQKDCGLRPLEHIPTNRFGLRLTQIFGMNEKSRGETR
jgi:hypothetical protein